MPLLWLSLAFLAGILLGGTLLTTALPWGLIGAAGALALLAEKTFCRSNIFLIKARAALRFPAGVLLLALAFGGLRYLAWQPAVSQTSLAYYNDRGVYTITARVSAPPDRREDGVYLELTTMELEDPRASDPALAVVRVKGKARARFAAGTDWRAGDVLRFNAAPLTPPDKSPFSYKDYLARKRVASVIYSPQQVKLVGVSRADWISRALDDARQHARRTLFRLYPQPESGLLAGILLGLERDLPRELERAYQETGTAHIIAISGFNMAVLAYLFMWFFNRAFNRYWAAALSALMITLYAVFVGGAPSVVRAAIMAVAAFGGNLIGRRGAGANALAFTAALMCIGNPTLPWDAGFQLSFAATLGLVLFAEPLQRWATGLLQARLPEDKALKIAAPLSEYFLFTLAAQLVTLPIIAWHFGRVSLSSLLANPLILPAQPPLLVLSGISAAVGSFLPGAGRALAFFAWPLAAYSNRVVTLLAKLNSASLAVNHSTALWLLLFTAAFILLFVFRGYFEKIFKGKGYWLMFLLALASFSAWSLVLHRPDGRLHLALLRAGDEATLTMRTPGGQTLVFDPGANVNELASALSGSLSPWAYRIDGAWFTRFVPATRLELLNERIPVRSAALAPPAYLAVAGQKPTLAPQGVEVMKVKPGGGLRYPDEVEIRIVAESRSASALLITYRQVKVLIPGGVDYALIQETSPGALRGLSLIVVGDDDIRDVPPRAWQGLAPAAILWRSAAVSPVEGWLNLEGGERVGVVSDGEEVYMDRR